MAHNSHNLDAATLNACVSAFFTRLAVLRPDVLSGDLSPEAFDAFQTAARDAATAWLDSNAPADPRPADVDEYRTAALRQFRAAAAALDVVADDLRGYARSDAAALVKHGAEYASHTSSKTTLRQRAQAASLDMCRAQSLLFDAVDTSSRS